MDEIDKLIKDRNHADYQCFQFLKRLIRDYYGFELEEDFMDEAMDLVKKREDLNEKFINLMKGGD